MPQINIDAGVGIGRRNHARDIAVADQHDTAAYRTQLRNQLFVARAVEDAGNDLVRRDPFGGGERVNIFGGRFGEVNNPFRIAGPDRNLVHISVGGVEQVAALCCGQHCQRIGTSLRRDRRALKRVERDVDLRSGTWCRADLLADEQHRGLVALAFTDNDCAIHVERVERVAHCFDSCGVSRFLVAPPDQRRSRNRRLFGDAHHFEDKYAVEDIARGDLGFWHDLWHPF